MKVLGLDHVSITTADIERSIAFYHDLLGIPVRSVGELSGAEVEQVTGVAGARILVADLDLGRGQVLELVEYVGAGDGTALPLEHPGAGHIGFAVEDLDDVYRRLGEASIPVRSAPVELTEPGDWHGVRCMTALDPDGVSVELVERPRTRETAPREAREAGSLGA